MFFTRTKIIYVIGMMHVDHMGFSSKEMVFMTRFNDGKTIFGEENYGIGCRGNIQIHKDWAVAKHFSTLDEAIQNLKMFSYDIKDIACVIEFTFKNEKMVEGKSMGLLKDLI
tara:strand:- start:76 stop:411 length:336 start_codon:yes stop_codon:yes gene_type:complete